MRSSLLALGCALFSFAALAEEGQREVFLHDFPIEYRAKTPFSPTAKLRVVLELHPGRGLQSALVTRVGKQKVKGDKLQIEGLEYLGGNDKPQKAHRDPSFLIDYQEASVRALRDEAQKELGAKPTMEVLARFVEKVISEKNMSRSYDLASVVASRREGDCTEHAVLLTALARAFAIPARVTHGLVLVEVEGRLAAMGHAWVEYHSQGKWLPADATLPPALRRAYLPFNVVENEGPGFAYAALTAAGVMDVRRVIIEE
jgi:hypothetical protein